MVVGAQFVWPWLFVRLGVVVLVDNDIEAEVCAALENAIGLRQQVSFFFCIFLS